jgi:hypothetical protein
MDEEGPMLCAPRDKADLEARNSIYQIQYIAGLANNPEVKELRVSHVLELHRLAVEDIYPCAGQFRTALHKLTIDGSKHCPPGAWQVQAMVSDMVDRVNGLAYRSELLKSAYLLWRCNWIHPFCGGNGRTARALAYLIVCMQHRAALPGVPSMPTLIMGMHADYTKCLRIADDAEAKGKENLMPMVKLVARCFIEQLNSAVNQTIGRIHLELDPASDEDP